MPVLTASQEMKEVALADEPKKETTYYGHTYIATILNNYTV